MISSFPKNRADVLRAGFLSSLHKEQKLPYMVRDMTGAAQQNGQPVAVRLFGEILFRNNRVPLKPLRRSKFGEKLADLRVNIFPVLAQFLKGRQIGHGAV